MRGAISTRATSHRGVIYMRNIDVKDVMLFRDNEGRILHSDDVDELSAWEIEDRGIYVYEEV